MNRNEMKYSDSVSNASP